MKENIFFLIFSSITGEFLKANKDWVSEVKLKEAEGYHFECKLDSCLNDLKKQGIGGEGNVKLAITTPSGRTVETLSSFKIQNISPYMIELVEKDFLSINSKKNNIVIDFQSKNFETVNLIMEQVENVSLYFKESWDRKNIHRLKIKLYDRYQECSFSIPDIAVYGWYEYREPIKISFPTYLEKAEHLEFAIAVLKHEFAHQVLSELTNDNAALFLQEGFALYNENLIDLNARGVTEEQLYLKMFILKILAETPDRLTLQEVRDLEYTSGLAIYHQGILWTNFLIEAFPKYHFYDLLKRLSNQKYMACRTAHKYNRNNQLTFEMITDIYGEVDILNKKFLDYYSMSVKTT